MKKSYKINFIVLLALIFFISACEKEDYTGHSTLVPTSPSITITGIDPGGYAFVEQDTTFVFGVTLSAAQVADVVLYIKQIDGDPNNDDYEIVNSNSSLKIPATETTGNVEITIKSDDLIEGPETFTLQIGDERTSNAAFSPVTVTFTIGNATEDILNADMSWTTNVVEMIEVVNEDISGDDVMDLRMLIIDESDYSVVAVSDGSGFESYAGFDTLADGNYLIAADIYSTTDFGDFDAIISADITIEINQAGIINHTSLTFPAVLNDATPCDAYTTYLARIKKTGFSYEMEEAISASWAVDASTLAGTWGGFDANTAITTHPSEVITTFSNDSLIIAGLGHGWMFDFWGEEVLDSLSADVLVDFDWTSHGAIIIPEQYYITTHYDGSEYEYTLVGTGTVNVCGDAVQMVIQYDMPQDGWSPAGWCAENAYLDHPYFEAVITMNPDGSKSITHQQPNKPLNLISNKPY